MAGENGGRDGQIVVRLGDTTMNTVSLSGQELTLGRDPSNGLVLSSRMVSSRHARLHREGEDWFITDVGSRNGTMVDTTTLHHDQPFRLATGAQITIGPFTLLYEAPQPSIRSEPPPADQRTLPPADQRPLFSAPIPDQDAPSRYAPFLPTIFQDSEFLRRFLLLFEAIWEPLEWRQDHIAMYFDPRTCPVQLLPWLAGWLDLSFPAGLSEGRMRQVLQQAMALFQWRGTQYGLERLIEAFTGLTPHISAHPTEPYVFQISLDVPANVPLDKGQLEALVRAHKPAHAGYMLEVLHG
jgi:phage tail-like protein